jgi:hypothetical protein
MAESDQDDPLTLDPPGAIAVVGAGPLGIEAALYGRYLGYDVKLYEAKSVGSSMRDQQDVPLPMLPDRCLSSLALSALVAQRAGLADASSNRASKVPHPLPMTFDQWINDALIPLTHSDLLRNRLVVPARVSEIACLPIEPDTEGEDTSDIPPDFQLTYLDEQQQRVTVEAEAVILATGPGDDSKGLEIELGFAQPADYFFPIGRGHGDDPEQKLRNGHREIVAIYAGLAGRGDLDLHRPRRG